MSELRTRMIRDMTVRGFSPSTHEAYIGQVVQLAKHYKRSPDQLTNEEVQAYLAYLIQERKLSWSTCSQAAHAFRFPLPRDAGAPAHGLPRARPQTAAEAASDPQPRGGLAAARGLHPHLASPPARHDLRRRPARQRGRRPQGLGSRRRPYDRPCPARQGNEGSVRAARQAPAPRLPRLLEDLAPRSLALS